MKKLITVKRFLTWLATIILEAFISLLFKNKLEEMSTFIKDHFIELFLIVLIGSTCIFFTIWFVKWIIHNIKYLLIKTKYYDVMLTKYKDDHPTSIYLVQQNDLRVFTVEEVKYLEKHFKEIKQMEIYMKGTNEVFNQFGKYT